ncbi:MULTISPECIES: ABC transporter ATP-binding protein [Bacillaceae]|uniref:Multidrug ABC transporter ATP-binding protein n=1 Tax=Domibacillus aminovorans TaxID=29332 RepID=A0A177KK92_9BACI|nr:MULTISPECIES: ABC transporter ATP-binding protein [Bacillaceae]OAH53564.1 multidrug ABC transporter ATP-binding protein [Domibacillus aminovorans]
MIKQFFSYYRPYKKLFFLDFFCAVMAGLLELAFPLIVNHFIDDLLPDGDWNLILAVSIGLLLIYIVNAGLQYVVTYWGHMLGINIETDMRRKLFGHVQKLSFRFFDNTKTGHLISRMTSDLMEIGEMAHHGPEDLFIALMTLTGAFAMMAYINWKLAVLTFIIIPVILWLAIYFNKKMTGAFHRLFGDIADFNARIEDSMGGIRVVQAFANEKHERAQFEENNSRFRLTKLLSYKIMALNMSISYMLMRTVTLFVLICGTYFVMQGELTYGEFVGFILLSNIFFRPIEKINAIIESYPKGIAGFKRYVELLNTEQDVADSLNAIDIDVVRGDIGYHNVTFGYEGKTSVLNNISLWIKAGETVAFVGPSGAGKTTMCSLLPRFYDVEEGYISIDGLDTKKMTLASLRRQIGIVQQDVFLFSGTIRENILYGDLGASDEAIMDALKRSRLDEFVLSLPEGLETVIGERGVKLSGGQKQRLAIARIFLKNPPILILDEATSALDTETELAIQQALAELAVGRTTLVIAHRLATIKHADRIIVVTPAGIEEQGSHHELLERGGHYRRLHEAQFGNM